MTQPANLSETLKKIDDIVAWFDKGDIDVEKALEKVKQGALLIKSSRARLREIENEFEIVKKELEEN